MNLWKLNVKDWLFRPHFPIIFVLTLGLGLTGPLAIGVFRLSFQQKMNERMQAMLGCDLLIRSRRRPSKDEQELIKEFLPGGATTRRMISFYSMLGEKNSRLVHVKAVEFPFPLKGTIKFEGKATSDKPPVWLPPELVASMGLKKGATLELGGGVYEFVGTVVEDHIPLQVMSTMAPTLYIPLEHATKSDLLGKGSTLNWHLLMVWDDHDSALIKKQSADLLDFLYKRGINDIKVELPDEAGNRLYRGMTYVTAFISLAGMIGLLLSLVGILLLYRTYIFDRLNDICLLMSLGMKRKVAMRLQYFQVMFLGFLACLVSMILVTWLFPLVLKQFSSNTPWKEYFSLPWKLMPLWLLTGPLVGVLTSFPILEKLRKLPLNMAFQETLDQGLPGVGRFSWKNFLPLIVFFVSVTFWQSKSVPLTIIFLGSCATLTLISFLFGPAVLRKLRQIPTKNFEVWKHIFAFFDFYRWSSLSCGLSMVLVGMATALIPAFSNGLQQELSPKEGESRPELFLFDIQEDEKEPILELLKEADVKMSPLIRGRLVTINGKAPFKANENVRTLEQGRRQMFNGRGLNLTIRKELSPSEMLVEGKVFNGKDIEISLEQRYAQRMQAKVGDTLEFDIQGIPITATVANLRKVRWTSFTPNFFIQFSPGAIDDAPKIFVASVGKHPSWSPEILQQKVVKKFPHVSIIRVGPVMKKLDEVLSYLEKTVTFLGRLTTLAGLFILLAVSVDQAQRMRPTLIQMRTLGGQAPALMAFQMGPWFLLVACPLLLGTLAGLVTSFFLSLDVFDSIWSVPWGEIFFLQVFLLGITYLIYYTVVKKMASIKSMKKGMFT